MEKKITIIIPFCNEGQQVIDCLESLYEHTDPDLFDVILVDDGSDKFTFGIEKYDLLYVRNKKRIGVGASFDVGVKLAKTENICLHASDIFHECDPDWLNKLIKTIEDNPKSFICTTCVGSGRKSGKYYGADIMFFLDEKNMPKRFKKIGYTTYRSVLDAKWRKVEDKSIYEIPCILGACYGVTKSWYEHVHGWKGHRRWGTLEPMISLKSYFAGGNCIINKDIETRHIFKTVSAHKTDPIYLYYNKLFVAYTLFNKAMRDRFLQHMYEWVDAENRTLALDLAMNVISKDLDLISEEKEYLDGIFNFSLEDFCSKFNIKEYDPVIDETM